MDTAISGRIDEFDEVLGITARQTSRQLTELAEDAFNEGMRMHIGVNSKIQRLDNAAGKGAENILENFTRSPISRFFRFDTGKYKRVKRALRNLKLSEGIKGLLHGVLDKSGTVVEGVKSGIWHIGNMIGSLLKIGK
jgi:hypothetical protein